MTKLDTHTPPPVISTPTSEVDLLDPKAETIHLTEICAALARINRYTGQTDQTISVAQHSLLCGAVFDEIYRKHDPDMSTLQRFRRTVLLHDAAEAYIGDVSRPLKRHLGEAYSTIEDSLNTLIEQKFGLEQGSGVCAVVKIVDNLALAIEVRCLSPQWEHRWGGLPCPRRLMGTEQVARWRYHALGQGTNGYTAFSVPTLRTPSEAATALQHEIEDTITKEHWG